MARVERIWHCMQCARRGVDRELDLDTPGTRDALFDVAYPTHLARRIALCGPCAKPVWDLEGLGEYRAGGSMMGAARLPYYVKTPAAKRGRAVRK